MFKLGEAYTRAQIHEFLGGSIQSFLPTVQGRVVCACLKKKMNPGAPYIILVGNKPRVLQAALKLAGQAAPIPVFLKETSNAWNYAGLFSMLRASSKKDGFERFDLAGRTDIQLVLELVYKNGG